jgi:type II secretory pathway pseudopilin PulG
LNARRESRRLRGFTILVALGVLLTTAGVLFPEFRAAERAAQARALAVDLDALNDAVDAFRRDHGDAPPGRDGDLWRAELLLRQLTMPTARDGSIHERGSFGPYLRAGIPRNPLDGVADVRIVPIGPVPGPDGNGGWLFHAPTARFHSNTR